MRTLLPLLFVACAPLHSRDEITLPADVEGVLAIHTREAVQVWAIDPARADALPAVIQDWDGSPITLAFADTPLARLHVEPGPIPQSGPRRVADFLSPTAQASVRTLEPGDLGAWVPSAILPELLASAHLPDVDTPCDGVRLTQIDSPIPGVAITSIVPIGRDRVFVGGWATSDLRERAVYGTATSTAFTLRYSIHEDSALYALAWDGDRTVWGIFASRLFMEMHVVALSFSGEILRSLRLDKRPGEGGDVSIGSDGKVIFYSALKVLELADIGPAIDRRADYPAGLLALTERSPDLRYAIGPAGTVHHFVDGRWEIERQPLTDAKLLSVDARGILAWSTEGVSRRDAEWVQLTDPHPGVDKLGAAPLSAGRTLVSGNSGSISIHDPVLGWCDVDTFGSRWLHRTVLLDDTHAVTWDDYDDREGEGTPQQSAIFWIAL